MAKEQLSLVPPTHDDAVVFKTRAESLTMGLPCIHQARQVPRLEPDRSSHWITRGKTW